MPFKQLDPSISQSIDEKPQSYGAIKSLCYILAVFEIIWGDIPRKRNDISSAHANDHLPEKTCQKHPLSSSWSWPGLSKHCPGGEAYFEASRLRPADLRRAWETREVINQKKHPRFYCVQKVGTPYIYLYILSIDALLSMSHAFNGESFTPEQTSNVFFLWAHPGWNWFPIGTTGAVCGKRYSCSQPPSDLSTKQSQNIYAKIWYFENTQHKLPSLDPWRVFLFEPLSMTPWRLKRGTCLSSTSHPNSAHLQTPFAGVGQRS